MEIKKTMAKDWIKFINQFLSTEGRQSRGFLDAGLQHLQIGAFRGGGGDLTGFLCSLGISGDRFEWPIEQQA